MVKYKTVIEIKPVDISRVIEICTSIAEKDETFEFKVEEKKYGVFLIIFSKERDQAHKRWLLFCRKYLPVEEGDEYLYWVKSLKE